MGRRKTSNRSGNALFQISQAQASSQRIQRTTRKRYRQPSSTLGPKGSFNSKLGDIGEAEEEDEVSGPEERLEPTHGTVRDLAATHDALLSLSETQHEDVDMLGMKSDADEQQQGSLDQNYDPFFPEDLFETPPPRRLPVKSAQEIEPTPPEDASSMSTQNDTRGDSEINNVEVIGDPLETHHESDLEDDENKTVPFADIESCPEDGDQSEEEPVSENEDLWEELEDDPAFVGQAEAHGQNFENFADPIDPEHVFEAAEDTTSDMPPTRLALFLFFLKWRPPQEQYYDLAQILKAPYFSTEDVPRSSSTFKRVCNSTESRSDLC